MRKFILASLVSVGGAVVSAQAPVSYTANQAAQGGTAFTEACASCHGANLDDGEFGPPLKGAPFMAKWGGKSADQVFNYMTTQMPPDRPNGLGAEGYAQILAFVLQSNNVPVGTLRLPGDATALAKVVCPGGGPGGGWPGGGLSPGVSLPLETKKASALDKITPVTDAMLANPPASEWLTWRRTLDYQGFSPLKQITESNVNDLRVAWTWTLPNGANEATPLIHDGVMFVHGFGDKVQALDASNGDLLWQYSRQLPKEAPATVKRNISIYGDKVYLATSDVHMVALDSGTGKVAGDEPIAAVKDRFRQTGRAVTPQGKVIIGTVGRVPGKNYIVAFDAQTGKEAWRFNTIAQPGEPGGNSWNGLPVEKRNGASAWVAGSYDPALNLVFCSVPQTS